MDIKVDLFQGFMHFIIKSVLVARKLRKPIIRKVEKRKVYSSFEDNIRGANFANMKLLSKCNKEF